MCFLLLCGAWWNILPVQPSVSPHQPIGNTVKISVALLHVNIMRYLYMIQSFLLWYLSSSDAKYSETKQQSNEALLANG